MFIELLEEALLDDTPECVPDEKSPSRKRIVKVFEILRASCYTCQKCVFSDFLGLVRLGVTGVASGKCLVHVSC